LTHREKPVTNFALFKCNVRRYAAGVTRCGVTLAGLVITNVAFVASAVLLEELGAAVLGDGITAKAAALLYTFNPASAFHSAIYTEPLFAALSFAGCLALVWGRR
jgi:phosphatidylinositol glycan class V